MKNKWKSEVIPSCNLLNNEPVNSSFGDAVSESSIHVGLSYEELFHMIHPDLFAHLSRVEFYVRLFCIEIAESSCLLFGKAAFFHDIGKIRIPHDILMKPDKLTAEESSIVRAHPKYAKEILMEIKSTPLFSKNPELFDLSVAASLSHHEWWNGAGYPFGIAGQNIPLIARITSICDAFDTITYGRPYCNARSANDAFCEIKKCAGSQFDPILSNLFVQYGDTFLR